MPSKLKEAVFIDPSSEHFLGDRLFDTENSFLNRDGTLLPFSRMRRYLQLQGIPVHTADFLRSGKVVAEVNHYWSLGMLKGYRSFVGRNDVRLRGFILFEPPLVSPRMYKALPEITRHFEAVYVHNVIGDGYSLDGVNTGRLNKLYWPQPYDSEMAPYWNRDARLNKIVVIAGNHNPMFRRPELYSQRIQAVAELVDQEAIDLYGRGWERWWSRHSAWLPYWRNRHAILKAYKGGCEYKLDVLSRYRFSLCLENMPMSGYLTEKLFDCLYAGTVPLYLGAPDVGELIPPNTYIDLRNFSDFKSMFATVSKMPEQEWVRMQEAGRDFLRGDGKNIYFDFMKNIINKDVA